jgi:hypothetical protein
MEPSLAWLVVATATPEVLTMRRYQAADSTRWTRVKSEWRSSSGKTLPHAFTHLKEILSAEEYGRMVREYGEGKREVRIEDGFIVTCFVPGPGPRA